MYQVKALVTLLPAGSGGWSLPDKPSVIRVPTQLGGQYHFDAQFNFGRPVRLGETVEAEITFLDIEAVRPYLRLGKHFTLWEVGTVAEAVVTEINEAAITAGKQP